ncbi:porin family protein [Pelomonas sp. SE-A7]|uniref:porin family protein n=1 Tax=Pelomonas sp. SE-A7 TaxID=3054953 RepID=UPI00259CC9E0|nr:porin family protein [Pelomonas sp. SE-A7]MDM4765818.1 porin family protein [Pelomonas sp. SE-A7]
MIKNAIVLAALAISASQAMAAEPTWYIGGDIGRTEFKADGEKDSKTGFGFTLGYKLNENLAFELQGRRLGSATQSDVVGNITYKSTLRANSLSASVLGIAPLSKEFSLFGRLGYARNTLDYKVTSTALNASADGHKNKALFGFGGDYQIDKNLGLRLEYVNLGKNTVKISGVELESKISQINLGLNFAF